MRIHRFSVSVNCCVDGVHEAYYDDQGLIMLPESYQETGTPTRLVICCHGAGGSVTAEDSQIEHGNLARYLVANGYAVMDVNGLPEKYANENGISLRHNVGSPIAISSLVKGYRYCMEHFNLYPEVFVHGSSMGGMSSTNLVLSQQLPVIAQSGHCPALDTYSVIFLNPKVDGFARAVGKIYGLDQDENGEFIYSEEKILGHNPSQNPKIAHYPVPVKFWHCIDDPIVSFKVTERFVKLLQENGADAHLCAYSASSHSVQVVGDPVENPSGNVFLYGERLSVQPAVEDVLLWYKQFS